MSLIYKHSLIVIYLLKEKGENNNAKDFKDCKTHNCSNVWLFTRLGINLWHYVESITVPKFWTEIK